MSYSCPMDAHRDALTLRKFKRLSRTLGIAEARARKILAEHYHGDDEWSAADSVLAYVGREKQDLDVVIERIEERVTEWENAA